MARFRQAPAVLFVVLLTAAFSGCVAPTPTDDGADGDAEAAVRFPWGLDTCRASWWLAPASSDVLRAYLPEGFEPSTTPQLPGLDVAAGLDTYLGFDAFECRSGAGLNGSVEPIMFGSLFTRVTPPPEHAVDGLDGGYFFRWEVLVPDQPRFARFDDLGLAVRTGHADIEALARAGSPGPWQNTLELDGLGRFTFRGSTTDAEARGDDVPYAAYTPAAGNVATWLATATNLTAAGGWGEWTVEPGSWLADALGADEGVGPFSVGVWSISDASLVIPTAAGNTTHRSD